MVPEKEDFEKGGGD